VEVLPRDQIDPTTAEQRGKLPLELEVAEPEDDAGREVDQKIDVTRRAEVRSERRAEEGEFPDTPAAAELRERGGVNREALVRGTGSHARSVPAREGGRGLALS